MGKLPTMRSDKSEILPYNFKNYFVFIGTERLSDHPNRCMFNHWHDDLEIVIPIKGHMIYNINGDLIRLEPGKGVFVNSNQIHYGFSSDDSDCVFIYVLWHPMLLCATNEIESEYDSRLIQVLNEENVMRSLGTAITTSGEHKINIAATKPAAAWIEEGGALTFGDATFDQIILDAHKLHVAVKVTEELLYDNAFNLENYILEQFGKALANAEEDAFINGNGTGQPLGILAETGGAQVGVTTKSSGKVTADEIIDLVYSLKRPYRKNAVVLANDACVAELRKLKDSTGQYLWQPSLQAGEPDRVLGYKVYTSAYFPLPAPGKAAVAFGDFSYYNIGDRGSRSIAELKELFAGNGMVGFVAKERVDGKLILPEAVQILKLKTE